MPTYNLNDVVTNESHPVSIVNASTYHTLIPLYGPFFKENMELVHVSSSGVVTPQVPGVDFNFALMWISASRVLNDILYGGVTIQTPKDNGYYRFNRYKTAGSQWSVPVNQVYAFLVDNAYNPRIASWEQVIGEPALYPPTPHTQPLEDFKGFDEMIQAVDRLVNHIMSNPALSSHTVDPDAHGMMKANNVEIGVAVDDVINNRPITSTIADKVITLRHLKQFIEESGMLAPDVTGAVSVQDLINHTNSTTTHNDIRLLISALTTNTNSSLSTLTSNLNNHTAAVDPHPQYTTSAELDSGISTHNVDNAAHADIRSLISSGSASTTLAISTLNTNLVNHTSAVDPHPQYMTVAEVDTKITEHNAATDPHPQYPTETEVDSKVTSHNSSPTAHTDIRTTLTNLQTSITNHSSATDPHPQYMTETEVDAKVGEHNAEIDPHPQYPLTTEVVSLLSSHNSSVDAHSDLRTLIAGKQDSLGFTPVQQGGGTNQTNSKIHIGWTTAGNLGLHVDSTDFSANWPINVTGNSASVSNGVYTEGDQTINGNKTFTGTVKSLNGTEAQLHAEKSGTNSSSAYLYNNETQYGIRDTVYGRLISKRKSDNFIELGGILPVSYGGTGADNAASARTNLDVYSKVESQALVTNNNHNHGNYNNVSDFYAYGNWNAGIGQYDETTVSYKTESWVWDIDTSNYYTKIVVLMLGQIRSVSANNDTSRFRLEIIRMDDNVVFVDKYSETFTGDQATNMHAITGSIYTGGTNWRIRITYIVENIEPPANRPMVMVNCLAMTNTF